MTEKDKHSKHHTQLYLFN